MIAQLNCSVPAVLFSLASILAPAIAAQPPEQAQAPSGVPTLRLEVNAVLVPVVVRDAQGHAVGNLSQADFKVLDQGKPQIVIGMTLVQSGSGAGNRPAGQPVPGAPAAATPGAPPLQPQPAAARGRTTVFLFDDRHLAAADTDAVKQAAMQMLAEPLPDGDRAVVISFLGLNSGMSHDHAVLQAAVQKLKAGQTFQHDPSQCPDIDYYAADQILNRHNDTQFQIAIEKAANCSRRGSQPDNVYLEQLVRSAANQALVAGDQDVRATLGFVRDVVHTLSGLPGQRTLILISPGFLSGSDEALSLQSQILDLAAASSVTISAVGAQGLSAGNVEASQSGGGSIFSDITGQGVQDHRDFMRQGEDAMAELAEGTGGTFIRHRNDLAIGLKTLAAPPEYLYLLEVSLKGVKQNGSYHALQVKVDREGLKVAARRGYFAPRAGKGGR
jgi:VWFA-related protein